MLAGGGLLPNFSYANSISHSKGHQAHSAPRHPSKASKSRPHGRVRRKLHKLHNFMEGKASYYAQKFAGRKTAAGHRLNMSDFVAAHPSLPLGTKLKVTNLTNGKSVYVEVDDRMSKKSGHVIDLTEVGAQQLGIYHGIARVKLEKISDNEFAQHLATQCQYNPAKAHSVASQVELAQPRTPDQPLMVAESAEVLLEESK
jgi:rare lipoprotein A